MEFPYLALLQLAVQEKPDAIIVRLIPPKSELARLADVLINSLGLSGALALLGMVLGIVLGGVMFWVRHRSA